MSETDRPTVPYPAERMTIGTPVCVWPGTDNEAHGVVVDDFGETAGHAVDIGGTHIANAARRWAVRLANGSLAFVDNSDIAAE
jgi:hypothetical protein